MQTTTTQTTLVSDTCLSRLTRLESEHRLWSSAYLAYLQMVPSCPRDLPQTTFSGLSWHGGSCRIKQTKTCIIDWRCHVREIKFSPSALAEKPQTGPIKQIPLLFLTSTVSRVNFLQINLRCRRCSGERTEPGMQKCECGCNPCSSTTEKKKEDGVIADKHKSSYRMVGGCS